MADYISQFTGSEIDSRLAKVPQIESALEGKQATLVSGTNIKTINGQPVLGSGDMTIQVGDTDAVKYVSQTLTDAQKAQARANIDAASLADIADMDFVTATTLPTASASTMGHIYLIGPDANDNYDRYFTQESSGSYSWVSLGSTQIDLSDYATQEELSQLEAEVDLLVANIKVLYNALGNGAFWGNKPVIDWGGETVPITVSLTNCTIDNDAESVNIGRSYYATLTPATGYILGDVAVTMGSTSVPVVNGIIDIDEVTGPITIVAAGANLDTVAFDNKTYRQIFETNNSLGITPGFENGSYSPLVVAQGTPTITDEDSDSGTYSLKVDCSGASANLKTSTSSKPACFNAYRIKVTRYAAGDFGMQNKNDQSVYQQGVCDWKTIAFHRTTLSSAVSVFIGCYNSADGTAYIDTPVVVLDSVFSAAPTLTKFTELYDNYVAIKKLA